MMSDDELFALWQAGDGHAGAALIERHFDAIARFFRGKGGQHADDLVQRTFLVFAERAATFRGEGTLRAFLFGIARNVLHEHLRGRMRSGGGEPDFTVSSIADLAPGVATVVTLRTEQKLLFQALQQLALESQILLELTYWEELGVEELAQVLAIPPGTVKSRLLTARAQLRDMMERLGATPGDARPFTGG